MKDTESNAAEEVLEAASEGQEQQTEEVDIQYLHAQIEALKSENTELKNDILRKQADFENFRKRMQREKQESIKYANSNLLQDIITIIDDFERAIRSSEESKDFDSFHSGIKMIEHQFVSMLERKYGLERMEAVGKEFDPQKHEAIGMEESADVTTQVVLEDYQKGYVLNDRVLRHAKVKVAVPASTSGGGEGEKPDNKNTSPDKTDTESAEEA